LTVVVADDLRLFLAPRHRDGAIGVPWDGISSLGHVVESLGIPLTETGELHINGEPQPPSYRPMAGDLVLVSPPQRPQPLAVTGFILDVHLGGLARRMRLVGIDTAYSNDRDDDALIELANAGHRALLTKDRGLLRRRKLALGAYVRGDRPDAQLADVLDRFAPPLAPWTRCLACNGPLSPVPKCSVEHALLPGTRRSYQEFSRCARCGQVYWRGAHNRRLAAIVNAACDASSPHPWLPA
jgi:uncharacterized protein with PIN domain